MPRKLISYNLGDPEDYNPIILSRMPEEELRAEYARLRRTAQNRIRRIERSEFGEDTPWIKDRSEDFKTPASQIRAADLPSALSDLAGFLEAKTSTVSGLRRKRALTLEALKESGVKGINKQNYNAFTQFMKATQVFKNAYIPYPKRSEKVSALQEAKAIRPRLFKLTENGISQDTIIKNFEFFKNNLSDIESMVQAGIIDNTRDRKYSANDIRKIFASQPDVYGYQPFKDRGGFTTKKEAIEEAKSLYKPRTRKKR